MAANIPTLLEQQLNDLTLSDDNGLATELHTILMSGLDQCLDLYMQHGCRTSKKTDHLNATIIACFQKYLDQSDTNKSDYTFQCEYDMPAMNFANKKRCDIVVFYKNQPHLICPLKFIMSSYNKNKNNYFESMTGEVAHLRWATANQSVKIIPINIIMDQIPMLNKNKQIINFETITQNNSFRVYDNLMEHRLVDDMYNIVLVTEHCCPINSEYNRKPILKKIIENRSLLSILHRAFTRTRF